MSRDEKDTETEQKGQTDRQTTNTVERERTKETRARTDRIRKRRHSNTKPRDKVSFTIILL